ncbi:MAG: enolase C-terminal domain-like protein [Pseudonocardiaceae bacterium]
MGPAQAATNPDRPRGPVVITAAPIESVAVTVYTVPTDAPEADGTLAWGSTTMVLVEVRSGEVCGTGWTYGPPACAQVVSDQLADVVLGGEALDVGGAFDGMVKAVRNAGRPGAVGYAISAVDVALWDLKARLLELPLHRLLGAVRGEVPVYGSGGFTCYDADQLGKQLAGWVYGKRIPRVKIKIGESWGADPARDLERMAQARDTVGPEVELFVDANGGYDRKQAIRVIRAAADCDIRWFEEPVSSDDLEGLREVRDAVAPDVTAGEYGYDLTYFRRMCAAGAVDCLQADVSRCGGITEWFRVAAVAAAHHLEISGHCAPHLHVDAAMATPNVRHLEWFHDHVRIEQMFFDGALDPTGGAIRPRPTALGHGLELRCDVASRYRAGSTVRREWNPR